MYVDIRLGLFGRCLPAYPASVNPGGSRYPARLQLRAIESQTP